MAEKYTEAQTDRIIGEYNTVRDEDYATRTAMVKALAEEFGVADNSIRGKLVSEGIYKAKEATKKTATTRVDKEALAGAFEASFGVKLKSIRNMTGKDLQVMWEQFNKLSDARNVELGK